jgi:hypothetical protein
MKKRLLVILAIALIFLSITIVYLVAERYYSMWQPPPHRVMPLIDIDLDHLTPTDNLTQGMIFLVNVTVYSDPRLTDKELLIPFSLSAERIIQRSDLEPYPEATEFTYSYEPSSIILKPGDIMYSVLTVELFEDAPVGNYRFLIEPGNSDVHHVAGIWFDIDVNPK